MNKMIFPAIFLLLMLSSCAHQSKPVSDISTCLNNEGLLETQKLLTRFKNVIGPNVFWNDFDKVIPTNKKPYTGLSLTQLKHKYHSTKFARVIDYRTNLVEATRRDPSKARKELSIATELGENIIKSKTKYVQAIKGQECSFNNKYRTKTVLKDLAFEIEVFKGIINVTIPALLMEVTKGEEHQAIAFKRENEEAKQKKIAKVKIKQRQASYLAEKEGVYNGKKFVIQLLDYTNSTVFISVKNTQENIIMETYLTKCVFVETKFGGTECFSVVNGLTLKDQYGNDYQLYGGKDQKIHPNEVFVFKFKGDRALDSSILSFHIPAETIGSSEDINLKFPAKAY